MRWKWSSGQVAICPLRRPRLRACESSSKPMTAMPSRRWTRPNTRWAAIGSARCGRRCGSLTSTVRAWPWPRLRPPAPQRKFRSLRFGHSGDALILQDTHDDAAILRLAFCRLVIRHRAADAHCPGSEQIGERNVAFLNEDVRHRASAVLAELLIEGHAAHRRGMAGHLDHIAFNVLGISCQLEELWLV